MPVSAGHLKRGAPGRALPKEHPKPVRLTIPKADRQAIGFMIVLSPTYLTNASLENVWIRRAAADRDPVSAGFTVAMVGPILAPSRTTGAAKRAGAGRWRPFT